MHTQDGADKNQETPMLKAGAVQSTRTSALECEQSDFPQHKVVIVTPDVVPLLQAQRQRVEFRGSSTMAVDHG